jgi:hypothetical protein
MIRIILIVTCILVVIIAARDAVETGNDEALWAWICCLICLLILFAESFQIKKSKGFNRLMKAGDNSRGVKCH